MATADQLTVVFVPRRTSLRSVLAQACLEHLCNGRFRVVSCGRSGHLADELHPAALGAPSVASTQPHTMVPTAWHQLEARAFATASFITLDAAMQGHEPFWLGKPDSALWDVPDVAGYENPGTAAYDAIEIYSSLRRRAKLFVNPYMAQCPRAFIRDDVKDDMGRMA